MRCVPSKLFLTISYAQRADACGPAYNSYNNAPIMGRPSLLLLPLLPCSTYLSLLILRCTTRARSKGERGELRGGLIGEDQAIRLLIPTIIFAIISSKEVKPVNTSSLPSFYSASPFFVSN